MFYADEKLCTGCGQCVLECPKGAIVVTDGIARPKKGVLCWECGHCIAVCPADAAWLSGYDRRDIIEGTPGQTALDARELLRAVKGRRSVRRFKSGAVEREKIEMILEAARFTPTASNSQSTSYIVVQKELAQLKRLALESLKQLGEQAQNDPQALDFLRLYSRHFIRMHQRYHESNGKIDRLFFNAPAVIVAVGERPVDAGMAASNMELMAFAQGLGCVFVGFFARAAAASREIREFLKLPDEKQVLTSLALGYSDVNYLRSVPRKKLEVEYI